MPKLLVSQIRVVCPFTKAFGLYRLKMTTYSKFYRFAHNLVLHYRQFYSLKS